MKRLLIALLLLLVFKTVLVELGIGGAHLTQLPEADFKLIAADAVFSDENSTAFYWLANGFLALSILVALVWQRIWVSLCFSMVFYVLITQYQGSFIWTPPDLSLNALFFAVCGAVLSRLAPLSVSEEGLPNRLRLLDRAIFVVLVIVAGINISIAAMTLGFNFNGSPLVMSTRALQTLLWLVLIAVLGVGGLVSKSRGDLWKVVTYSILATEGFLHLLARLQSVSFSVRDVLWVLMLLALMSRLAYEQWRIVSKSP